MRDMPGQNAPSPSISLRAYQPGDAEPLCAIFFDAVHRVGRRYYSQEQVQAWAPCMPDPAHFEARATDGRIVLVAVDDAGRPAAYGELELNGHIDHLYCRPDMARKGIASALYDRLEAEARSRGFERLFVEASEAARPLFLRKGFQELERREFLRRGTMIHNYAMAKSLDAAT
jgi:putative acetyltransferase